MLKRKKNNLYFSAPDTNSSNLRNDIDLSIQTSPSAPKGVEGDEFKQN
jgi:hypothetical protein